MMSEPTRFTRESALAAVSATYAEIDNALTSSFFAPSQAGIPVYLDMDDDCYAAAATTLGLSPDEFSAQMISAVRALLNIGDSGYRVFGQFDKQLKRWGTDLRVAQRAGADLPAPPIVALLTTLTAAAETMGDSQVTKIHDSAYYARLLKLLGVPETDTNRFKESFRQSTEAYWDALRIWLEALDGDRGLPSAYALSMRYVGLPISQALVRETERRQLKNMFSDMALPAGMGISQIDMESSLGQWITATPSPASSSMRQLWSNPDSRSRVVEIAIVEFDSWDGYGRENSEHSKGFVRRSPRCSLAISERHTLFGSQLDVGFVLPVTAVASGAVFISVSGGPIEIPVVCVGNLLCGATAKSANLQPGSLLSGVLNVTADNDVVYQRYPRNVIPLVRDAFANVYVETERIIVGEPSAILVRDQGSLPKQVAEILLDVARPGYVTRDSSFGAPEGWVLHTDVQVLKAPEASLIANPQLDALVPRLGTQMTLTGGLRLPGRIARWSALDQPQLAVASEELRKLRVTCTPRGIAIDDIVEVELAASQQAPFVVDVANFRLPEGDYVIALYAGEKRLQTQTLRLRSSDERDEYSWNRVEGLAHRDSDDLWPIRAASGEGSIVVDGAISYGAEVILTGQEPATATSWRHLPTPWRASESRRIDPPAPDSCIVTGAHKIILPTFSGKAEGRWVFGSCSLCGLTKRSPAHVGVKELQRRKTDPSSRSQVAVSELTRAQAPTRSWRAVVDTLIYLGTGTAAELHALARQIEDTATFEHLFVRSLESLGVIETDRDENFKIRRFEIASTSVAELEDASFLLAGAWPRANIDDMYRAALRLGGKAMVVEPDGANLPLIAGLTAEEIVFESGEDVEFVRNAGRKLLTLLPRLSEVANSLPRVPMEFAAAADLFSTNSASWIPTRDFAHPGSYRIKTGYASTYIFRSAEDIENGTVARVPFDLAKHLAAQTLGKPIVAYNRASQQLRVPSGANLPGLYERAAVLCSGELPLRDASTFSLVYTEINEEFARALMARLV